MTDLTLYMENQLSEEILNAAGTCRLPNPDPKDLDHWSNDDKPTESESPWCGCLQLLQQAAEIPALLLNSVTWCHHSCWLTPQQKLHLIRSKTPELTRGWTIQNTWRPTQRSGPVWTRKSLTTDTLEDNRPVKLGVLDVCLLSKAQTLRGQIS